MRTWTNRELNKLRKYYPILTTKELEVKIPSKNATAIKSKAKVLGIKKVVKDYGGEKKWKPSEDKLLRELYNTHSTTQIGKMIGRSKSAVKNRANKLKLKLPDALKTTERCNRYKKGSVPQNKGKKMSAALKKKLKHTFFQKGHKGTNTLPLGTITVRNDKRGVPYQYIKVRGKMVMPMLHVHLWKKHYGKIPKGKIIVFKDKNTMNCTIENLEAITRYEHMMRNTIQRYPVEIKQAIRTISKLNKTINHAKEQN